MLNTRRLWLMALTMMAIAGLPNMLQAATPDDLKQDAQQALSMLIKANPSASLVSRKAKATLIFFQILSRRVLFLAAPMVRAS